MAEPTVSITLGRLSPISLPRDVLSLNSGYFRTMLDGGFSESISDTIYIPWDEDEESCACFLTRIAKIDKYQKLSLARRLTHVKYCTYFQVSPDVWEKTQLSIRLPERYADMDEECKGLWVREVVPFEAMRKIVKRVCATFERFIYIFAWLNEHSIGSSMDNITNSEDFENFKTLIQSEMMETQAEKGHRRTAGRKKDDEEWVSFQDFFAAIPKLFGYPLAAGVFVKCLPSMNWNREYPSFCGIFRSVGSVQIQCFPRIPIPCDVVSTE